MGRGACSSAAAALAVAALLGAVPARPLRADWRAEQRAERLRRAQDDLWQLWFGQRVVASARRQLGRPYLWGGASPAGFDCSGLTEFVFRGLGVPLARTAWAQYRQGVDVDRLALLPGDLVFFTGVGAPLHVGIYEGRGRFLHAPGAGKPVQVARLDAPYFARRYVGARRMTPPRPRPADRSTPTPPLLKASP